MKDLWALRVMTDMTDRTAWMALTIPIPSSMTLIRPIGAATVDGYTAVLGVPEITDDIYYNGAVLVYRLIELEPKSFNLLPYTFVDNALSSYMDCDIFVGSINLYFKEVYNSINDTPAPDVLWSYKVVIFEGIPLATLKTMVDVKDYNAVTKMFHVETGNVQIQ